MTPVETITPETRPTAPGALGVLQQFMNSGHLGVSLGVEAETAAEVRERAVAGEHSATLAKEFGIGRMLVSALGRGVPMFDEMGTPQAASEWLRDHGLIGEADAIERDGLEQLTEFRELLRALAVANAHGESGEGALQDLTTLVKDVPLVAAHDGHASLEIRPAGAGAKQVIGRLLVSLYDSMRDGSWKRLKRCPGLGCPFTFYDSSRNRTSVWCSMSVCGNRAKVAQLPGTQPRGPG